MNGATDRHSLREICEEERADVCAMVPHSMGSRIFFRMCFRSVNSLRSLLRSSKGAQRSGRLRWLATLQQDTVVTRMFECLTTEVLVYAHARVSPACERSKEGNSGNRSRCSEENATVR